MSRKPGRAGVVLVLLLGVARPGMAIGQTPPPGSAGVEQPPAVAAAPQLPAPQIAIAGVTEDKQHLLRATVTLDGKPLEGVNVSFGAVRTFGVMDLGMDTTLDDGTAAIPYPETLPGDATGHFEAVAAVQATAQTSPASAHTRLGGVGIVAAAPELFPHALWSSKPLWPLVAVIAVLLTGVWATYTFVVVQLVKIRREESPR